MQIIKGKNDSEYEREKKKETNKEESAVLKYFEFPEC
jgi:hypothetical protein